MDNYSEEKFEVKKKVLLLLVAVLAFLVFAYVSGEIVWIQDTLLFVELLSSILAIFIGILALMRFYTKKSKLNFLMLGVGFLFVGVLESVQLISSVDGFVGLFSYIPGEFFPLSMVLSKSFLAIIVFLSWFVRKDYENPDKAKEKLIYLGIVLLFTFVISIFLYFTNVISVYQEYIPALIGGILSMLLFVFSILGYWKSRTWRYGSFEYWLIFSLIFLLISTIFFVPLFNLEYDLMIKFSVFARFFSYIFMLVGFLVSIYEMYGRELEYLEELKEKNVRLIQTKNSVEEAYMLLRKEKWNVAKGSEKVKADSILQDVIDSHK
ncbi:TPA: hypothetical protein DEP90_00685 [Patescibacteria group bacterium]|nr:hypothetical protein [Patescibacteria group bacterium]